MDDRIAQYYREQALVAEVESLRATVARVRGVCAKPIVDSFYGPIVSVSEVLRALDGEA